MTARLSITDDGAGQVSLRVVAAGHDVRLSMSELVWRGVVAALDAVPHTGYAREAGLCTESGAVIRRVDGELELARQGFKLIGQHGHAATPDLAVRVALLGDGDGGPDAARQTVLVDAVGEADCLDPGAERRSVVVSRMFDDEGFATREFDRDFGRHGSSVLSWRGAA